MTTWLSAALSGLGLGLSLIVAIGAQNAFVLRQGLRRDHVLMIVAICAFSDLTLIALGVGGAGLLFTTVPALVEVARWVGAVFLMFYGALAARRAVRPSRLTAEGPPAAESVGATRPSTLAVAATCLALTWLNPHVYLDTVVLLGSVASTHGECHHYPGNRRVEHAPGDRPGEQRGEQHPVVLTARLRCTAARPAVRPADRLARARRDDCRGNGGTRRDARRERVALTFRNAGVCGTPVRTAHGRLGVSAQRVPRTPAFRNGAAVNRTVDAALRLPAIARSVPNDHD
jgi:L-lysine exporter family protein LysE/ArgO